jgi:hypothetical protein
MNTQASSTGCSASRRVDQSVPWYSWGHLDEVSLGSRAEHSRQMYFEKFPNVKEFVAVNAKASKNIPNLLKLVISLAQQELLPNKNLYLLRFFKYVKYLWIYN